MLPDPALDALLHNLHQTQMGLYIHLSQVNRAMRRFFLSDYAWARFDVHQVEGKGIVYSFGEYTLTGIAAHYFNYLYGLDPLRRAWHMYDTQHRYCISQDPYDEMNLITRLSCGEYGYYRYHSLPRLSYSPLIWDLWVTHDHNTQWPLGICTELYPLLANKRVVLSLIPLVHDTKWWLPDRLRLDEDIAMELFTQGRWDECPDVHLFNADFLLEALTRYPHFPGNVKYPDKHPRLYWFNLPSDFVDRLCEKHFNTVIKLVANTPWLLGEKRFAKRLRRSVSFVLACVKENANCLNYAHRLRYNLAVATAAVDQCPRLGIYYAAPRLQDSAEFVQLAIERDPWCIEFASERLKQDPVLALYCFARDPRTIKVLPVGTQLRMKIWLLLGREQNLKI